ncbi:MAG: stage II sporulation protein D [Eubacteriales bacterium]|nr:stage II sporulation protein D [Eubacteriales bacterium]MDD4390658.1 stage II sporulation protein D [Eubacteriales bacterium]
MRKIKIMPVLKLAALCGGFAVLALLVLPSTLITFFGDSNSYINNGERTVPPKTISVYRTASSTVEEIDFEDYVKGVVAGEMPASFEEDALKAQAVAARTYSLSKVMRSGNDGFPAAHPTAALCDGTHCQVYRSYSELESLKGSSWMNDGYKRIEKAVDETSGQLMYYNGELAYQALFHSSSGGKTENSEDVFVSAVPYLRSVESTYEEKATHKDEKTTLTYMVLAETLNKKYPDRYTGNFTHSNIKITDRTEGGRVNIINIGNASYSGREIRDALGLASANFTIDKDTNTITFVTSGYGHGVGMSQYGANGMAEAGHNYKQILKHYYTGVEVY